MSSRMAALVGLLTLSILAGSVGPVAARPLSPAWDPMTPFSSETATVTIDGHVIDAEIADTSELRERGLSYRDGLTVDTGMLFIYRGAAVRSFWMFGMRFCLDIVWINDGRVVGAAEGACPAENPGDEIPTFRSPAEVQYVLEVDAGWMAAHDVSTESVVDIELPASVAADD